MMDLSVWRCKTKQKHSSLAYGYLLKSWLILFDFSLLSDTEDLWFVNSGRTIHLLDSAGSGTSVYSVMVGQRTQDTLTKTMSDPSGKFTWNTNTGS